MSLDSVLNDVDLFLTVSRLHLPRLMKWIFAIWVFNIVNWFLKGFFNRFGIRPRRFFGLIGIPLAPFLHANFTHLLFNTAPLLFLALFIDTLSPASFYKINLWIIFLSGFGVWLIGRRGIHLGASALIAGYFGYVLVNAYQYPSVAGIFCAVVAFYYFGSILLSLFPSEETTSWEGHLTGFMSGIITVLILQYFH